MENKSTFEPSSQSTQSQSLPQQQPTGSATTADSKASDLSTVPLVPLSQDALAKSFEEGLQKHDLAQYKSAFSILGKLEKQNYFPALVFLGRMHGLGHGVPKNATKAEEYLKRAGALKDKFFEEEVGPEKESHWALYLETVDGNPIRATEHYIKAAERDQIGDMQGRMQYHLHLLYKGSDRQQSMSYFNQAKANGYVQARYLEDVIRCESGKYDFSVINQAAKLGYVDFKFILAKIYYEGINGDAPDYEKAERLLREVVGERGLGVGGQKAANLLKECIAKNKEQGVVKAEDKKPETKNAYPQASDSSSLEHSSNSSQSSSSGEEFDPAEFERAMQLRDHQHYNSARVIFEKAAEAKYPPAFVVLGLMNQRDEAKAKYCYEQARKYEDWFKNLGAKPSRELWLAMFLEHAAEEPDLRQACIHYEHVADNKQTGHMQGRAQYYAAECYAKRGTKNKEQFYRKAAEQSEFALALYRAYTKNEALNFPLIKKLADSGLIRAKCFVAARYYEGENNTIKHEEAEQMFRDVVKESGYHIAIVKELSEKREAKLQQQAAIASLLGNPSNTKSTKKKKKTKAEISQQLQDSGSLPNSSSSSSSSVDVAAVAQLESKPQLQQELPPEQSSASVESQADGGAQTQTLTRRQQRKADRKQQHVSSSQSTVGSAQTSQSAVVKQSGESKPQPKATPKTLTGYAAIVGRTVGNASKKDAAVVEVDPFPAIKTEKNLASQQLPAPQQGEAKHITPSVLTGKADNNKNKPAWAASLFGGAKEKAPKENREKVGASGPAGPKPVVSGGKQPQASGASSHSSSSSCSMSKS